MTRSTADQILANALSLITAENTREQTFFIGQLIGRGDLKFDDTIDLLRDRLYEVGFRSATSEWDVLTVVESGMATPLPPDPTGSYVLIPGEHVDASRNRFEVSGLAFADAVLAAINPDSLYRMDTIVGHLPGPVGERSFRTVSVDQVRLLIDASVKLATWTRATEKRPARLQYVPCSRDLASLVLARAESHPSVRPIKLVVSYPVFAPHGLLEPGYSEGYFYDQPYELSDLPEITDHRAGLADLLIDFPFKSEADRQNFISLLITPFVRPALRGNTPLFLIQASLPRTGKSKLAEQVLGGILLGRATPAMQLNGEESEIDKRIVSLLLKSQTVCHLDNLRDFIDSASLASLITAETYAGRCLGRNEIPNLPNNLTVVGSGNNVRATSEVVLRSIPIFLQPKSDHPELRTDFVHPDVGTYVRANRRNLVGAIFTMIREWIRAKKPLSKRPLGGFERWSAVVGGIMEFHGYDQWMSNYSEWCREGDPQGEDLRTFVSEWFRVHQSRPQKPRDLWAICSSNSLFDDLVGSSEIATLTKFSKRILARHKNSPVNGFIIRKVPVGGSNQWFLDSQLDSQEKASEPSEPQDF